MKNKTPEKIIQISLVIITIMMTIFRFLFNEKGRVLPDSIRYMRQANIFPIIDNTTAPLGYPLIIKFFTLFGFDEFWSSKLIGILAYLFIVIFSWRTKFYHREIILVGGLFSFVSIFSATLSEAFLLPFLFVFLYVAHQTSKGAIKNRRANLFLSALLILMLNIRYSALFFVFGVFLIGILNRKESFGRNFIVSALIGFVYYVGYKIFFIDYFNEEYVDRFLSLGIHSTSQLLLELFQGLATTFNPFIHIASPNGGLLNIVIYGIGTFTIISATFVFLKDRLSKFEAFAVFLGIIGIICSFFIQYFYSTDPLDYRLLAGFSFPIWLVFFKKSYDLFGNFTYAVTLLSLMTGGAFIWLSSVNYLENRKKIKQVLEASNIKKENTIYFYHSPNDPLEKQKLFEFFGSVHPKIYSTTNARDTLKRETFTPHKVREKIKLGHNKFQ